MVQITGQKGTAGAFMVIAILLGSMAYNNMDLNFNPLGDIEDDAIFVDNNEVFVGQEVIFNLQPVILSDLYGIQYFMWDFHDNSYIVVSTPEDRNVAHTFERPGEYLVSVMAIKGNISRIFTIPMSVIPEPHQISIEASSTDVLEDEIIFLSAQTTAKYTEVVNYLWEYGDGITGFGIETNHSYAEEGQYTIKVKAYTNNSLIYTQYQDILVNNQIPEVNIQFSSSVIEDDVVSFTAGVIDGESDKISMKYIWQFGDGLMAEGKEVKHIYTQDGNYSVTLTAIDNNGGRSNQTSILEVKNGIPQITSISHRSDTFFEGQTITTFATFSETSSDYPYLQYDWSVPGDGSEVSLPYYENGNITIDLTITDDDYASDYAISDSIQVLNDNPYVSLISANAIYDIEFIMWGSIDTRADITLFKNGLPALNFSITNVDLYRNTSRILYRLEGLDQPLDEYWDILINMNDTIPIFDTYVGVNFISNIDPISTINHCSSESDQCVSDSYRLPVSPVDRGFTSNYNFSVFDPGNDDLTVYMDIGSNHYSTFFQAATYGASSGFVTITGNLPYGELAENIVYWVEDEDDASSNKHNIPFLDYGLLPRPDDYTGESTWEYWGNYITHYAPVSIFNFNDEFETNVDYSFMMEPIHPDPASLKYLWNFGTGFSSLERYPTYSFDFKGEYMLWVVISDDYYDYVEHIFLDVKSLVPEFTPLIKGVSTQGTTLTFMASGMEYNGELEFYWDFGDGNYGFGDKFDHAYTNSGNYSAFLTVIDRYNMYDTTEMLVVIYNTPPKIEGLASSLEVIEGNNVILIPDITESPLDHLNLEYNWIINGDEYDSKSVWFQTDKPLNDGLFTVTDVDGSFANFTFNFNVTSVPLEMTIPLQNYIYGDPNTNVQVSGTISTSIFERNTKMDEYDIYYILYDRDGHILDTGTGEISDLYYGFTVAVNTSSIGTDRIFEDLATKLLEPKDLTDEIMPSGTYSLNIRLEDGGTVIATSSSSIVITIDKDGDFITDELEVLFDNTLDDFSFSIHSSDTDDNGIADPVEYVIGNDKDGDGIPLYIEEMYGTSDENPDTDGDGLTDGFGPFGELQIGSSPTKKDTDNDGLEDGEEVQGWSIELITTKGLVIKQVTSSPIKGDTDNDGVSDYYEFHLKIDPRSSDTDLDGLTDLDEQEYGTSLLNKDTDFDTISDFDEATIAYNSTYIDVDGNSIKKTFYLNPVSPDSDDDGLSDYDEVFLYGSIGTNKDTDSDGILDADEIARGTDILNADTDGDGLADGVEISGFEIPIVLITDGVYNETGHVLTAPTVRNYTITVYTNPLNMDTDGDGLTDWEELMGDSSTISDPTNVDSDGDGILDPYDSQRLVSDFEPANITSDIEVKYGVRPGETLKVFVKNLTSSLSALWDLIKGVAGWAFNLLASFWYWKKVCVWRFCIKIPWLRSINTIISNIKAAFRVFVLIHIPQVFETASQFNNLLTNTLKFEGFGIKIKKAGGIPYGFTISGVIKMIARNIVNVITGIVDPTVNFKFDVEDEGGIDKIVMYQDGVHLKTIENINRREYTVNEAFSVAKNGFELESTTILFEIHDIGGNVRFLERTTSLKEFAKGLLDQGITFIKETALSIIKFAKDIFEWTLDAAAFIGEKIVAAVVAIGEFVNDTYHKIKDWVIAQFDKIWEGFIRETMNLLQRGGKYMDRADLLLVTFSDQYQESRGDIEDQLKTVLEGDMMTTVTESLNNISDIIDEYIPPIDTEGIKRQMDEVFGPIADLFSGTIIELAYELLSGKALEILGDVIKEHLGKLLNNSIAQYVNIVFEVVNDLFEQLTADLPEFLPISLGADSEDTTPVDMFLSLIEMVRNPAAAIVDLIQTYDTEFILNMVDNFMIDNPDYLVSINDIIRTMLKPGLVLGLVIYDILNFVGSIFSPSLTLNDVSVLNIENTGATSILDLDEAPTGFKLVSGIIAYVGKFFAFLFSEANKIIDMIDMCDGDREGFRTIINVFFDFVFLMVIDFNEIVASIVEGIIEGFSPSGVAKIGYDCFVFIIKVIQITIIGIATVITLGNPVMEILVTWADIIFSIVAGIIDLVAKIGLYIWAMVEAVIDLANGKINGWQYAWKLVNGILNLITDTAFLLYDSLSDCTKHGTWLLNIPPIPTVPPIPIGQILWAAYAIFAASTVFFGIMTFTLDVVGFAFGW